MRFAGFLGEITTLASRLHLFTGNVTTSEESLPTLWGGPVLVDTSVA
jgi:hypothetical protein